jgi:hypothetical protein
LCTYLRKRLLPWCKWRGFLALKQVGVDEVTQIPKHVDGQPIPKYKKQQRLKGFFHSASRASGSGPRQGNRSATHLIRIQE